MCGKIIKIYLGVTPPNLTIMITSGVEGREKRDGDGPITLFVMFCVLKKKDLEQTCKKVHLLNPGSRWQQILVDCLPISILSFFSLGP